MIKAILLIFLFGTSSFTQCLDFYPPSPSQVLNTIKNWYYRSVFPKIDLAHEASISLIAPGLYLGNACAAKDQELLQALNITHVLTIESRPLPKGNFHGLHVTTMFIKATDSPQTNLLPYFPMSNAFIENGLRQGKVLVHCHYGVSRSATLVIAYLMQHHNIGFEEAFDMVARSREFINPNSGFVSQLREYERQNFDVSNYQRVTAFMAIQGRRHKYKLFTCCAVLVTAIIVPVFLLL